MCIRDSHNLVARLVKQDVAIPLSLNFDGFTRKAINKEIDDKNRYCLIVNDPSQLREFLCAGTGNSRMMPFVVKVWGDVFHAV